MMSVTTKSPMNTNVRTIAGLSRSSRPMFGRSRLSVCGTALIAGFAFLPEREPADHHHAHDDRALDHLRPVLVDALDDHDRLDRVRTNAAAIGPTRPPTPPSSETPPSTTAATEFSV